MAALEGLLPSIGTDESGKGDFFGPLVCAGVYVDEASAEVLQAMGVRDSKRLSDRRCRELAEGIQVTCHEQYSVVEISPARYNDLYEQFRREGKNLNTLLAWAHARVLENLLAAWPAREPSPTSLPIHASCSRSCKSAAKKST